jgi:hypothetical protein
MMMLSIRKYISISKGRVRVNGNKVFSHEDAGDYRKFIRATYKHFNTDYPKFFKMDTLSKLGFMSVEILLKGLELSTHYAPERIGLILTNASSSLEVDEKHNESIRDRDNYFPSPSNFVYTLPNIMAGEAAIRHVFRGENTVLISKEFDAGLIHDITGLAFETSSVDCCICGWTEQYGNKYESLLFLIEQSEGHLADLSAEDVIFEPSNLQEIYKRETEWKN